MASLALGVPVVTNRGFLTECGLWEQAVALAPEPNASSLAREVVKLLCSEEERNQFAKKGHALYESTFALQRMLERLMAEDGEIRSDK